MKTGIFFDVDGTLRDIDTSRIPGSTKAALRMLRAAGFYLGIATGRTMGELSDDIVELIDWDAYVCANGQVVYDKNKEPIFQRVFTDEIIAGCLNAAAENNNPLMITTDEEQCFITATPNTSLFTTYRDFDLPIPEVREYSGESAIAIMVFPNRDEDYEAYSIIPGVRLSSSGSTSCDILYDDISKYDGALKVMDHCGLEKYIAFGDSMNDFEIMLYADISVAMGGSPAGIAGIATCLADTVLNDGIYSACKELRLL